MAKFSTVPREGHLTAVVQAFGYIKKHLNSKLVFDSKPRFWSHLKWTSRDWKRFFPDINGEILPRNMPQPKGKSLQINMFCDSALFR
jgi:hypothetical protein